MGWKRGGVGEMSEMGGMGGMGVVEKNGKDQEHFASHYFHLDLIVHHQCPADHVDSLVDRLYLYLIQSMGVRQRMDLEDGVDSQRCREMYRICRARDRDRAIEAQIPLYPCDASTSLFPVDARLDLIGETEIER